MLKGHHICTRWDGWGLGFRDLQLEFGFRFEGFGILGLGVRAWDSALSLSLSLGFAEFKV